MGSHSCRSQIDENKRRDKNVNNNNNDLNKEDDFSNKDFIIKKRPKGVKKDVETILKKAEKIEISEKKLEGEYLKEDSSFAPNNFKEKTTDYVQLKFALKRVYNLKSYSIEVNLFQNSLSNISQPLGKTESQVKIGEDDIIKFDTKIDVPLYFGQNCPLEFNINGIGEKINSSLFEILGTINQTFRKVLSKDQMELEIQASSKSNERCIYFDVDVNGNLAGTGMIYTLTNLGCPLEPVNKVIYKSEQKEQNGNDPIIFDESKFNINSIIPLDEDINETKLNNFSIQFSLIDEFHQKEMCSLTQSLEEFKNKKHFTLTSEQPIASCNLNIKEPGEYNFIDYFVNGLNICSNFVIDFGNSNGDITTQSSFHFMNPKLPEIEATNVYQKLIKSFGTTLENFTNNKIFPTFGFGFKFKENFESKSKYNTNLFPLNNKPENPNIVEVNNILKHYKAFLENTADLGENKKNYDLILKYAIENSEYDIKEKGQDLDDYNLIIILTNNDLDDNSNKFLEALIESSFYPISVIVIGIGKNPFKGFENIKEKLLDEISNEEGNKVKALRKNFVFVKMNNFGNNYDRIIRESLKNIPNELIEFCQINEIVPKKY